MPTMPELQSRARLVADWLDTLPKTYAAPVVVKIGRVLYAGASYTQVRETDPSTPAYRSGELAYTQHALYLLGELPYSYRRRRTTAYRVPGARFPWFVAGWYDRSEPNEYHPFGRMFQLMIARDGRLEDDHGRPYRETPLHLAG